MMRIIFGLIILLGCQFPLLANASVAGQVSYISGSAWLLRGDQTITLLRGSPIHSQDVIITSTRGRVKLLMQDGSRIFVGRKSRMTIDKFDTDQGNLLSGKFNMLWGKVRFLVAKLRQGNAEFSVRTKTATIGVRGTEFSVMVTPPDIANSEQPVIKIPQNIIDVKKTTTVMLFEGAVLAKSLKGQLLNIKPGYLVKFKPSGETFSRMIKKEEMSDVDLQAVKPIEGIAKPKHQGKKKLRKALMLKKLESMDVQMKEPVLEPAMIKIAEPVVEPVKIQVVEPVVEPIKIAPIQIDPIKIQMIDPAKLQSLDPTQLKKLKKYLSNQ